MSNSHLYSVDGDGVAEEVTPPGSQRKPSTNARPKYPVPTDRMKFDTAVKALRAYCTLSRGGVDAVSGDQLAANLGVVAATATLNNMFFLSVGLISRATKGTYKPTEIAMKFHNKYSFDQTEAPLLLAPAFAESWFFEAVMQKLEITPDATRKQIIETLAMVAGTDSTYAVQYGQLLEWLSYVGLIVLDGDSVLIADEAPAASDEDEPVTPKVEQPAATPARSNGQGTTTHPAAAPPLISLSLEIVLTTDELSILGPEQITALFDGIGKIAAVKARLEEN